MVSMEQCYLKNICKYYREHNNTCPEDRCPRLYNTERLYDKAQLTPIQRIPIHMNTSVGDPDYDAYARLADIENHIVDFVGHHMNLYIHSSTCGNGKTSWAIKLLQAYTYRTWSAGVSKCRVLFIYVPSFLFALKDNISEANEATKVLKEYVKDADLVVWDEIGFRDLTQYESDQLMYYITLRLNSGKSNIYTSNQDAELLRKSMGERLYSRVVNESTEIILKGQDRRGLIHDSNSSIK